MEQKNAINFTEMDFLQTEIEGVYIVTPRVFHDARGTFCETWNEADFARAGLDYRFVQDNQSSSRYGTVRGLHFQRGEAAQAKLVRVLCGRVLDVAVDLRSGSPSFGRHIAVELTGENRRMLMIPRGFAHGFSVLSETAVFAYKCDAFYCPAAEGGIRYDDPQIGVDWRLPAADIVISEKDGRLPSFANWTPCF